MAVENAVAEKKEYTTALSQWTNELTALVTRDFNACGVQFDEYSKQCAMAAMTSIWQLVKDSDKIRDLNGLDGSNLREIVGQAASLKLNANAVPVETVYPCWLVKEGDAFEYPKHKGIEMTPPEWEEKGLSQKVIRVVYPLKLKDGTFQYLIAEREGVKVNLFAHVRNNLMNETFGLLKGTNSKGKPRTRYDATAEEKKQIDAKKEEIYDALRKCETLDDMLACDLARPYISAAWLDTPESMIVRKMRNNAVKKYRKDFNSMAKQSFNQLDETYIAVQNDIMENANSEDFDDAVIDVPVKEVSEQEVETAKVPFVE